MSDDQQMLGLLKSVADFLYRQGVGDGSVAVDEIVTRYERMKAEWIDPQRIVELAKRYTDQDLVGWVQIEFADFDPMFGPQWTVEAVSDERQHHGRTLNEALKEAEA